MGSCMSGISGRTKARKHDEKKFLEAYPKYKTTSHIEEVRRSEYPTLDLQGHIYLDYTGAGLYSNRQLRHHQTLLSTNIFGNPHSLNPTSSAMTVLDEYARACVLQYFKASPEEYCVIFTANASGALRLIGEAFPFAPRSEYILLMDNHNSVQGIREYARAKGGITTYVPLTPDLRVSEDALKDALKPKFDGPAGPRLFAYPAQSNFSGAQHPLEWIATAQAQGCLVCLDAAAYVPTNRLDLSVWHPDFVPISFYKMFGYPTGVGCLIARKESLRQLKRPAFAGGTVWGSSVLGDGHVLLDDHEGFEDGTLNFLNLPAIQIGLRQLKDVGRDAVHLRVTCLTDWLIKEMLELRHQSGLPLIRFYGPTDMYMRGGTIAYNYIDTNGDVVDERIVEQRGNRINLSLRSGCFCNPGASEAAFRLEKEALIEAFETALQHEAKYGMRKKWDDFLADIGVPTAGALRISVGLMSNFKDVHTFLQFSRLFLDAAPKEAVKQRCLSSITYWRWGRFIRIDEAVTGKKFGMFLG
ncbi:hypothetical protein O988_07092 [Pseudogymnoascus sp. VKM F-3808]|nr:hypothetical protein O988_07092 [Pseudogymnoascus sp. VKM F-3808]